MRNPSEEMDPRYDDVDSGFGGEDFSDEDSSQKRAVYPPRLMVDFTALKMEALQRYAQFYQFNLQEDTEKEELAAMVARHFDGTLEVDEDESLVSFIQRIRNGEKSSSRRLRDKDRKQQADKKRNKKSASRKRQRESTGAVGGNSTAAADNNNSRSASANASSAGGSHGSSGASEGRSGHGRGHDHSSNASSASDHHGGSSGSSRSHGNHGNSTSSSSGHHSTSKSKASKEKEDYGGGDDNELYCVCNLPSYGNMIACDGKKCPNPSQWYHLECVGFSDGSHPDYWLCPECDPKSFANSVNKKKKSKLRSKSPGSAHRS